MSDREYPPYDFNKPPLDNPLVSRRNTRRVIDEIKHLTVKTDDRPHLNIGNNSHNELPFGFTNIYFLM